MSRAPTISVSAIGLIHTPYAQAQGTPIQTAGSDASEGTVEVFAEFSEGLKDLEGFERIWLLYRFDRASEARLIVKPYLDPHPRGIFATRAPARPNHIGMSAVRLLGIDGNQLRVAGVDMLDGTPLLDIKPYVPVFDHFPVTRTGWYKDASPAGVVADDRFERPK
jgi:tRNA-Thr(GGU) m(6)t(6)A37 methyltransferase TsaA